MNIFHVERKNVDDYASRYNIKFDKNIIKRLKTHFKIILWMLSVFRAHFLLYTLMKNIVKKLTGPCKILKYLDINYINLTTHHNKNNVRTFTMYVWWLILYNIIRLAHCRNLQWPCFLLSGVMGSIVLWVSYV